MEKAKLSRRRRSALCHKTWKLVGVCNRRLKRTMKRSNIFSVRWVLNIVGGGVEAFVADGLCGKQCLWDPDDRMRILMDASNIYTHNSTLRCKQLLEMFTHAIRGKP